MVFGAPAVSQLHLDKGKKEEEKKKKNICVDNKVSQAVG